jgi:DNA repair photolyase
LNVLIRGNGNFLNQLEREAKRLDTTDKILLCFTTDPYQPIDVELQMTRHVIEILKANGLNVQILTKGGSRALRDIDLLTDQDAFATTLTLLDDIHSRKWEPDAALPQDRIETIKAFHEAGIPTWVSLEPVLNPDSALRLIEMTSSFVDLYKVGKLNYHVLANSIDWPKFARNVVDLLDSLGKPYYIKEDLKKFL